MARRKNVKRIDPRYFLHETVNRNDDGSVSEGCGEMDGEAIDISAPGTEVHVDDISQLSPEEAFAAGMAAARDAIDQVMGGPDGPPPDGGFSGSGPMGEPAMQETRWQPDQMQRSYLDRAAERVHDDTTAEKEAQRLLAKGAFKNAGVPWPVIATWLKEGGW